jgi:hypothetical protein
MGNHSRKNPRLLISHFKEMLSRSELNPELKLSATQKFATLIRAVRRDDRRGAMRATDDLLRALLRMQE